MGFTKRKKKISSIAHVRLQEYTVVAEVDFPTPFLYKTPLKVMFIFVWKIPNVKQLKGKIIIIAQTLECFDRRHYLTGET